MCDVVISKREARCERERIVTRPSHSKLDDIEEELSEEISASTESQTQ